MAKDIWTIVIDNAELEAPEYGTQVKVAVINNRQLPHTVAKRLDNRCDGANGTVLQQVDYNRGAAYFVRHNNGVVAVYWLDELVAA
jgi:hypothetical protein